MGTQDENLVIVYQAEDEFSAYLIKGILESEGIKVLIRSFQIPMYDNIIKASTGLWGEILVLREDLEKSKEIIYEYFSTKEESK